MNKKICILTDTASTFNLESAKAANVHLLSLNMLDGNNVEHFDDLTLDEISNRMKNGEVFKTSTTPLGLFVDTVKKLLEQYDQVIYFCVSSKISSQFSQANLIKDEFDPNKLIVFDSKTAGYTLEILVKFIAKLNLDNQLKIKDISSIIDNFNELSFSYFTCSDIKYIARSGRGGKKVLKYFSKLIFPIILFSTENSLETFATNLNGAINKLVNSVAKRIDKYANKEIEKVIVYLGGGSIENNENLLIKLAEKLNLNKTSIEPIQTPKVVFVHTGPGTFGVTVKLKTI